MWRSINSCYALILENDKSSQITKYYIRTLAQKGVVETLNIGSKFLINWISLKEYLNIQD